MFLIISVDRVSPSFVLLADDFDGSVPVLSRRLLLSIRSVQNYLLLFVLQDDVLEDPFLARRPVDERLASFRLLTELRAQGLLSFLEHLLRGRKAVDELESSRDGAVRILR